LRGIEVKSTRVDEGLLEAGAEARGLFAHVLRELEAVDAVREAGEIFHLARGGELAAGERSLEHEGIQAGAGGVNGGGETGATGADDDDVFDGGGHEVFLANTEPWTVTSATMEM
jgi:hypothetical protein